MKVIHYINQFYAQIGGEDKADHPFEVRKQAVGPGLMLQSLLPDDCRIEATLVCGDNLAAEWPDELEKRIAQALKECGAELLIAGPAFNAGRYGLACGIACKAAYSLGIPAVTGLYEENPGVALYRQFGFILPTESNARSMKETLERISAFAGRLQRGEDILDPEKCGYLVRGLRKNVWTEHIGARRAVNMALDKVHGRSFKTELPMIAFSRVPPSPPLEDLSKANVALVTTCGPVPLGNPDRLEAHAATKWKIYQVEDFGGPALKDVDIAHGGYSPTYAERNGNRVFPVDVMLELEAQGVIGHFHRDLYVTVGNSMPVSRAEQFGAEIARSLKDGGVDAAILTSA